MTVITTSPPSAPSKTVKHIIDATAGNEIVTIPNATTVQSNGWPEYEQVTVIKGDNSANTVTIKDVDLNVLGTLENQDDSMTLFNDATSWRIESNATATDAGIVAASLASHEAETEVHGATGDVYGATDVAAAVAAGGAITPQITAIHDSAQDDIVVAFTPGHATPVNYWRMNASGASAPLTMDAIGSDTDIDISFSPKGAGTLMEGLTPVALSTETDITAIPADVSGAPDEAEHNAVLAALREIRTALLASRVGTAP